MTLEKKLSWLRKKEGLSQAEVSEKLDVSRQAVSRWEGGVSRPSTENLQALCKLYNVQIDYLLDENQDVSPAIVPEESSVVCGSNKPQGKRKRWISWLVIGIAALALLTCCFLWYENSRKKDVLDLHTIQGEDNILSEGPDFDLSWE